MKEKKLIFHIDLNAFYCQCAENKEPFLSNVPFAVANDHNTEKGIITTSNYIARKYGVYSAMSILEAKRRCPRIRLVPPDFPLYKKCSDLFIKYLRMHSKKCEKASIDEAYLDLTDHKFSNNPLKLAKIIQSGLIKKYNLPTSIGISHTVFLAKMASDMKKPKGITMITDDNLDILNELDVSKIYGVGKKTTKILKEIGINFIKDFKEKSNKKDIIEKLGANFYTQKIKELSGASSDIVIDNRNYVPKSISAEMTFNYLISSYEIISDNLKEVFKRAYFELLNYNQYPKAITIRIKTGDGKTFSRLKNLEKKTQDELVLYHEIESFFEEIFLNLKNQELILVGCGFTKFTDYDKIKDEISYNLFNYEDFYNPKEEQLEKVIKLVNKKYKNKIKWKNNGK